MNQPNYPAPTSTPSTSSSKGRYWSEIVLVLAVLVAPIVLLSTFPESIPPGVASLVSLLLLPTAALISWILMRMEWRGAAGLGLGRPESWGRTLGLGLGVGVGILLVATFLITPLIIVPLFGTWLDPSLFDPLRGDFGALLVNVLVVSWLHAAISEEIVFRGFFLQRFERAMGGGTGGVAVALVLQAALFGLAHYPQGAPGIVATFLGGILWGAVFLWTRRSLWVCIIGHAVMDTILFLMIYLGLHRLVLPG